MTGEDCSDMNLHGRSGRVALPRTKLVLAIEAALFEAPALRAERAAPDVRKSVADMVVRSQLD
jgi:hypothetical protein